VSEFGKNNDIGLLINSTRQIIYASSDTDFAEAAANEAKSLQQQMKKIIAESIA
jgi:orotidine-5'-phosphate decarboxylase